MRWDFREPSTWWLLLTPVAFMVMPFLYGCDKEPDRTSGDVARAESRASQLEYMNAEYKAKLAVYQSIYGKIEVPKPMPGNAPLSRVEKEDPDRCPSCGYLIQPNAETNFCYRCGYRLKPGSQLPSSRQEMGFANLNEDGSLQCPKCRLKIETQPLQKVEPEVKTKQE